MAALIERAHAHAIPEENGGLAVKLAEAAAGRLAARVAAEVAADQGEAAPSASMLGYYSKAAIEPALAAHYNMHSARGALEGLDVSSLSAADFGVGEEGTEAGFFSRAGREQRAGMLAMYV